MSDTLRKLIADDAYAMSFQSLGQYRKALLDALAASSQPEQPSDRIVGCRYCCKQMFESKECWNISMSRECTNRQENVQPAAQPAQDALICATCNADRSKEDCKSDRAHCTFVGTAYTAAQPAQDRAFNKVLHDAMQGQPIASGGQDTTRKAVEAMREAAALEIDRVMNDQSIPILDESITLQKTIRAIDIDQIIQSVRGK